MQKLFIDFVGKFPRSKSGNTYALVCIVAFTKFVWIFPVREASTATTIRALNFVFAVFGVPEILVSDNACLAHEVVRARYNATRKPVPFHTGDIVWFRNFPISKAERKLSAKLSPRYKGPFRIAEFTTRFRSFG
jgi:hypothetical protein